MNTTDLFPSQRIDRPQQGNNLVQFYQCQQSRRGHISVFSFEHRRQEFYVLDGPTVDGGWWEEV